MLPNFTIINPKVSTKKPFYDSKKGIFYFPCADQYRYYLEVIGVNDSGVSNYYLLLSPNKFDDNCRKCTVDFYKRCHIYPKGELKEYIERETQERGNITCKYVSSEEDENLPYVVKYDIWLIE